MPLFQVDPRHVRESLAMPASHPVNADRVTSVDGLRGLLATWVMLAHLANASGDGHMIPMANLCVTIFFAISGYVLTRAWTGHFPGFLVRRFFRLWPVYALCLAVGGYMIARPAPLAQYFYYPFMGIHDQPAQDPVMWSLFIEAWAMLFMPLIVWIGRRPIATGVAIAGLVAIQGYSKDLYYGAFFIGGSYCAGRVLSVKVFDTAVVQWLGRISYSLYLSHLLVIAALKFHVPGVALYVAAPACFAVAHLIWYFIERPSIWLSRRLGRKMDALTAPLARKWRASSGFGRKAIA